MKNIILTFLVFVLAIEITTLIIVKVIKPRSEVLGLVTARTPISTLTPIPSPVPITTPTPTFLATPTPVVKRATPTPTSQPKFMSQQIYGFTESFAGQYGVDANVIRALAVCESGFNPDAKYLNYVGLFQFSPTTWKNIRLEMGEDPDINLRANAEEAVQTAAYAVSKGMRGIWPNCNP